jgi:hypothetical protein
VDPVAVTRAGEQDVEDSISVIGIPETTPMGRIRRLEQIRWTTVVREVM